MQKQKMIVYLLSAAVMLSACQRTGANEITPSSVATIAAAPSPSKRAVITATPADTLRPAESGELDSETYKAIRALQNGFVKINNGLADSPYRQVPSTPAVAVGETAIKEDRWMEQLGITPAPHLQDSHAYVVQMHDDMPLLYLDIAYYRDYTEEEYDRIIDAEMDEIGFDDRGIYTYDRQSEHAYIIITVSEYDSGKRLQTIRQPVQWDYYTRIDDCNFDGYPDILLATFVNGKESYYSFIPWNETAALFDELLIDLPDGSDISFDGNREIMIVWHPGSAMAGGGSMWEWRDGELFELRAYHSWNALSYTFDKNEDSRDYFGLTLEEMEASGKYYRRYVEYENSGEEWIKVLDFGVVTASANEESDDPRLKEFDARWRVG